MYIVAAFRDSAPLRILPDSQYFGVRYCLWILPYAKCFELLCTAGTIHFKKRMPVPPSRTRISSVGTACRARVLRVLEVLKNSQYAPYTRSTWYEAYFDHVCNAVHRFDNFKPIFSRKTIPGTYSSRISAVCTASAAVGRTSVRLDIYGAFPEGGV